MIASKLTLSSFFESTFLRDVCLRETTEYQYRRAIEDFSDWNEGEIELRQLTSELVNGWVASRQKKLAPITVKNRRNAVVRIWRCAAERGLVSEPGKVRKIPIPQPVPIAWSLDEMRRLLACCPMLPPHYRLYFRVLLSVGYQTGLRRSDLLALDASQFDEFGVLRWTQAKTLFGHVVRISAETLADLQQLGSLKWTTTKRNLYYWIERLCGLAGVPYAAIQQLRRTGATYVERDQPGASMRYLGHRTPGLAYRHYVDRSKLNDAIQPPKL